MKTLRFLLAIGLIVSMLCLVVGATELVPSPSDPLEWNSGDVADAPSSDVQSPQTGVSETGVAAVAVSVMVFAAGAVVSGKKLKNAAV